MKGCDNLIPQLCLSPDGTSETMGVVCVKSPHNRERKFDRSHQQFVHPTILTDTLSYSADLFLLRSVWIWFHWRAKRNLTVVFGCFFFPKRPICSLDCSSPNKILFQLCSVTNREYFVGCLVSKILVLSLWNKVPLSVTENTQKWLQKRATYS